MANHLILPRAALTDVQALLRLEEGQLRALAELFATAQSVSPQRPEFLHQVSERLHIEPPVARAVVLVCQVLLAVVEEGGHPRGVVDDVRDFVAQHSAPGETSLVSAVDAKRPLLEALLTPKAERIKAQKVRYLARGLQPTVRSFRTVCELRPVFERQDNNETIVGYVPVILLEVRLFDAEGEERTVLLTMSPEMMASLDEVLKRTTDKLRAIQQRFGKELLGGD